MSRKSPEKPAKGCVLSRFGLHMGKEARRELIRRVWRGDVRYARKITASRTVIVLDYAGVELAFLYSSAAKDIISFFAADAPEIAEWSGARSRPASVSHSREPGQNGDPE
jgi:hypothetical protein